MKRALRGCGRAFIGQGMAADLMCSGVVQHVRCVTGNYYIPCAVSLLHDLYTLRYSFLTHTVVACVTIEMCFLRGSQMLSERLASLQHFSAVA